jgi:hypothetical protein
VAASSTDELVAAGEAVVIGTAAMAGLRPDVTAIPLDGVEPSHVVLATRADDRSRLVGVFRGCAREHLASDRSAHCIGK